jgi:integrase
MAGRAEDALHLCWENIQDLGQDGGEVYIPPGKAAEGYQDLTQQTMRLLKRLNVSSRAEGAVFSQWHASKNPSNSMRAYLKDNVKRIAPEFASFQTHDLRKSKLRQMLASRDFDIAEVQAYGRHKDIRSTQRYVEPDATRLREKMRDLRRVKL